MKRYVTSSVVVCFLVLAILFSCGKDDPTGPNEGGETIFSENTVILDQIQGVSIQSISSDKIVITFSSTEPDISSGDCIVSSEVADGYFGFIRRVSSVSVDGNTITIETSDARLTDAVIQCSVDTSFSLSMALMTLNEQPNYNVLEQSRIASGSRTHSTVQFEAIDGVRPVGKGLNLSNVVLYSGNVSGSNVTVTITSGNIEFEPSIDIGWEIENSQVTEFHSIASGDLVFNCDIEASLDGAMSFSADTTLASYSHTFVQFIGYFPVVEVVTLSFVGGFSVETNAAGFVETGFDHSNTISVGAQYDGSWSSVWEYSPQQTGHQTDWTTSGEFEIRGFVRPVVSVDLYGIMGPYLSVEPFLGFRGGVENSLNRRFGAGLRILQQTAERIRVQPLDYTFWWELVGGVTGTLGFDISILGYSLADFNTELFEWEIVLDGDSSSSSNPSPSVLSLEFTGETDSSREDFSRERISGLRSFSSIPLISRSAQILLTEGNRSSCQVTADWTECPDSDFLSYTLFRSGSSGIESDTSSATNLGTFNSAGTVEYLDNDVTWETGYYYALFTQDTEGLFSWSNEATITTPSSGGGGGSYPDSVVATTYVGDGPGDLCSAPAGDYVYVVNQIDDSVAKVRTADNVLVGTISVGYLPGGICILPSGDYLYVTSTSDDNVSVIRTSDFTVTNTIDVGNNPRSICSHANGQYVYVVNNFDDNVSVIQTSTNTVVATIPVGDSPWNICTLLSGEYLYVTNADDASVSVIRTSNNTVVATVNVISAPKNISVLPSDDYVYVTSSRAGVNNISVIRTSDNTVVGSYEIGDFPYAISSLPTEGYVYITHPDNDNVSIVQTSDNTVVATVGVGDKPRGICALPSGDKVYVTNFDSDNISVLAAEGGGGGGEPTPSVLSVAFSGDSTLQNENTAILEQLHDMRASSGIPFMSRSVSNAITPSRLATCQTTASWTECPDADFQSYTLYRSDNPGISQDTSSANNLGVFSPAGIVEFIDNDVLWETDYYYALLTRDTENMHAWSNEIDITTPSSGGSGNYPDSVVAIIDVGYVSTVGICTLPTGEYVYVANSSVYSGTEVVTIIRTLDNEIVGTIDVGDDPFALCVLPSGDYLYVTNNKMGAYHVSVVRTSDNMEVANVTVGSAPTDICALPSNEYVYVACQMGASVSVIRTSDNSVVKTINFDQFSYTEGICTTISGEYVYVAARGKNQVYVVRTSDNVIEKTINVGELPTDVCSSISGDYVYVANEGGTVTVIRTSTNTAIKTINVGGAPASIASHPSGDYVYVVGGSGGISVIRTSDNTVVSTIATGGWGICFLPSGERAYVTAGGNNSTVYVLE